jgi:hypothetical protein
MMIQIESEHLYPSACLWRRSWSSTGATGVA